MTQKNISNIFAQKEDGRVLHQDGTALGTQAVEPQIRPRYSPIYWDHTQQRFRTADLDEVGAPGVGASVEVINDLGSTSETSALSANAGRILAIGVQDLSQGVGQASQAAIQAQQTADAKFTKPQAGIGEIDLAAPLVTKINTAVPADNVVTPAKLEPNLRAALEAMPQTFLELMARLDALEANSPSVLIQEIIPDLLKTYSTVLQAFPNGGKNGWLFGLNRVPSQPGDVVVDTDAKLAADWTCFLPGTGELWINSQIHTYASQFGPGTSAAGSSLPAPPRCHTLLANGLELRAIVAAGTWDTYLRGQVNTTNGININGPVGTVTTPSADAGVPDNRLADIRIGDVVPLDQGAIFVAGVNVGAKTILFRNLSRTGNSPVLENYKSDYALEFTRMSAAVPTNGIQSLSSQTFTFNVPVAAQVVPGCFAMFGFGWAPKARGHARVETISTDRLTVTFDQPINSPDGDVAYPNGIVLFLPEHYSAQINSKEEGGPVDCDATAYSVRVTPGLQSRQVRNRAYTKTDRDAWDAAYPDAQLGRWDAWLWFYAPALRQDLVNMWRELDKPGGETWHHYLAANSEITFNVHNETGAMAKATRTLRLNPDNTTPYPPGASWITETGADVGSDVSTANVHTLVLPSNKHLYDGQPHELSCVWTKHWSIQYIDNEPVCITYWDISAQEAGYRMICNLGCGAINFWSGGSHFFPRSNAKANAMTTLVHEIRRAKASYQT